MATEPASRAPMTADELLRLPGGMRRELIGGELHEINPAGADHGTVAMRIGRLIDQYAERHGGRAFAAETGFRLQEGPDTVRAPDAAYVTAEHARRVGATGRYWPGAPDLVAEVLSPPDSYTETHEKALLWLAHGAGVVLLADPASRHVTRYRSAADIAVFSGGQRIDCAPTMPGFEPSPTELIPRI